MTKKRASNILNTLLSLALGGGILWWMYRGFDLRQVEHVLFGGMDWTWMWLSFPFGVSAQALRGWRWRQTLEPMGERPRMATCQCAVFASYAASLVIPRSGEFLRCAVLRHHDGTPFTKALGTVVTERAIDSALMLVVASLTLAMQVPVFSKFFAQTGTTFDDLLAGFTATGWIVTAVCALAAIATGVVLVRRLSLFNKVREAMLGIWQGICSVRHVRRRALFVALTLGIWVSYFLHYYLTFFCFDATSGLGWPCALVTFVVGSFAVLVPTPNGAGPWHFAVKTMLILYGVATGPALCFVLIVHGVQTLLVAALGAAAWLALGLRPVRRDDAKVAPMPAKPKP